MKADRAGEGVHRFVGLLICLSTLGCDLSPARLLEDGPASDERTRRMNVVLIDASNGSRVEVPVSLAESYVATHCAPSAYPQRETFVLRRRSIM